MSKRVISVFMLAMINVAAMLNIANLPLTAQKGFSLLFYYGFAGLCFFLPSALVAAELATGWPQRGGIYVWVKEALGSKMGFLAIWLQWLENVVWYPTILSFIAATFAYIFAPSLAQNKIYILSVILTLFWAGTFINFFGMKISGWVSTFCVIIGTIIPASLIIFLGLSWLILGHPAQIEMSFATLIPSTTTLDSFSLFAAALFAFCGIEMSAVHAQEVQNPQKNYPKAIFLAGLTIFVLSSLGALSIALVVPKEQIQFASGSIEAFRQFFAAYQVSWALPIIAVLMVIGCLGQISTWIVGPTKGILVTALHGELPPLLQKTNKHQMPIALLITQGIIISLISFVFLHLPSVSMSYRLLLQITAQVYLLMYLLMFISVLVLRYKKPNVKRVFKVPFGKFGIWSVSILGILSTSATFLLGFFPPSDLPLDQSLFFILFLTIAIFICCAIPLIIHRLRKPSWKTLKDPKDL